MEDNETTADLIAWLRRPREGENAYLTVWRDEIADRLEAALKRELSKNTSKNGADFGQLGDAAKLREALKQVNELNDLWFDTFTLPDGATSIHDEIEDVISAALAAPTRNCDRPECVTTKAAQDVWRKEDGGKTAYYEWLLATATEKEGGAK